MEGLHPLGILVKRPVRRSGLVEVTWVMDTLDLSGIAGLLDPWHFFDAHRDLDR